MKVLTIKEPFASLLAQQKKHIETRSWKTNYRGELYIHAGLQKIDFKDERIQNLLALLDDPNLKYGHIIAKCELKDCIYMDESFLKEIEQNPQEKICGEYQLGRYAWVIENIELLEHPIEAKGKLSIWNYQEKE